MFGFLKRLFYKKDSTERLWKRWKEHPAPQTAEKLALVLMQKGGTREAVQLLKQANSFFPNVETLKSYYHKAIRLHSSCEIRSLRQILASNPQPEIYARLAELYRYTGHFEEAMEVAHDGIRKYPQFAGNFLALGRIRFSRFLKTSSAQDGRKACAYLEKAFTLDPGNLKTIYHLTTLFLKVGAKQPAQFYARKFAELLPGNPRTTELTQKIQTLPDGEQRAGIDYFARYEASAVGNKGFGEEAHTGNAQTELNTGILKPLRRLAKTKGINGFQFFNNEGKQVDGVLPKIKVGRDKFVTVLREIMEAMRINSRRMTIGAFQESTLLLENQKLFFYDLNDCYLIVFSEKNLQDAWLRRKVTEFVENNIVETAAP